VRISNTGMEALRSDPRHYVPVEVEVEGRVLRGVGLHLKGSAGSKRSVDDRPAFTLNFDRFNSGQRAFGLQKLHFNNSVQDGSGINESLASRTYRAAGIPATRVTHALLTFNGQFQGLYVVKEPYDDDYLRRHFPEDKGRHGNLYDGGFISDILHNLERDGGNGPRNHEDLVTLRNATSAPLDKRPAALAQCLDLDRFRTLMAIQYTLDDWDGYVRNRNNYRIYFRPDGRATFLPSGMDQLLRHADAPIRDVASGRVAGAVLAIPAERLRLRDRMRDLSSNILSFESLAARFDEIDRRIEAAALSLPENQRQRIFPDRPNHRINLRRRIESVRRELAEWPDPAPPWPKGKTLSLSAAPWSAYVQTGQATTDTNALVEGRRVFQFIAQARATRATLRTTVTLPAGRFRFSGKARAQGVEALTDDLGVGVGLRLTGATGTQHLEGNAPWSPLAFEFEQGEDGPVEFIVEIKAHAGTAWFDPATLSVEAL
jgi:hypothetical protein